MSEECTACALCRSCITNKIDGRGPAGGIMLVGQGPGAYEDVAGEPFVGPSGKLLDRMLRDAGHDPAAVFLTNATRCRPPKSPEGSDRAPLPAEIEACREHLRDEILRVRPKVLVALGDTALRALCHVSGITGKRGTALPLHPSFGYDCEVYATWHPAYVMKVPNAQATVVSDLRRVRDRNLAQTTQAWAYADGEYYYEMEALPLDAQTFPARLPIVAYDIETYDYDGTISEDMTQIAAYAREMPVAMVSKPTPESKEMVLRVIRRAAKRVSHFGWDFDDAKTGLISEYDTAALAYLDDETQPLALESLCVKYLGVRGWKEARDDARLGTDDMAAYNARDAYYTLMLYEYFAANLGTSAAGVPRIRIAEQILQPLRVALDECTRRGIYIDGEVVRLEGIKQDAVIESTSVAVREAVEESGFPVDAFDVQLKTKIRKVPFNPGSALHVGKVMEFLGYTLPKTGTSGQPRTDEETLLRFAAHEPFVTALLAWRGAAKRKSTYIKPYAKIAAEAPDGRVHCDYTVFRTVTGRTSAREPNIQNLDRELKAFLSAPPGECLTSADYAAIEFWGACWYAKIDRLIDARAVNHAFDPHRWFASILYGEREEDITKAQRQIAKSANFSQLYLGTADTIRNYAMGYGIDLTPNEAARISAAWKTALPEFPIWWESVRQELLANSYVESPTGRRRHFGDVGLLLHNMGAFKAAWREAANAKVQGLCTGDIAFLGLIAAHQDGLPVCGFIHDDVKYHFGSLAQAQKAEPRIRAAMLDSPIRVLREQFNVDFPAHLLDIEITHKEGKRCI